MAKKVKKSKPKQKKELELTPEEYDQLSAKVEEFQDSFLSFLAGTSQFEIIPTTDEFGEPISEENLNLIKRECKRLGFKILYSVDNGKYILVINPETMKTGIVNYSVEMH